MSPDTLSSLVVCWRGRTCQLPVERRTDDCTHLHVESCIETHLQISILILDEYALERLLEERHVERIGENHIAVGVVSQRFHLE